MIGFLKSWLTSPMWFLLIGLIITMGVTMGLSADSPSDIRFNESMRENATVSADELADRQSPEERMMKSYAPGAYNATNQRLMEIGSKFPSVLSPAQKQAWQSLWVDVINAFVLGMLDVGEAAALWAYHNKHWLPGQAFVLWLQGVTFAGAGAMFYYFRWPHYRQSFLSE